jgi:REP element-mobilizing transposase RayT
MSQSLAKLYIHLTFSTKHRTPCIPPTISTDLHAYVAGTLKNVDSPALIINSVNNHIHVLFRLSKNIALTRVVEEVKKGSSRWMKQRTGNSLFYWQTGYSAFSVISLKVNTMTRCIARQQAHHKHLSYREEIEQFMKEYDVVEYNPDYFWE